MRIKAIIIGMLVATLLPAIPLSAQETSKVFRARFEPTRSSNVDCRIEKSDTIDLSQYLNTRAPIYSLSVDATIEQPREASFTRIVLEDTEGRDHLVLECDRFRNDTSVVNLREFCQETALLFGITPSRLKCYVAGNAIININSIYVTDQKPQRGQEQTFEKQEKQHKELRRSQVLDVVNRINVHNREHRYLWIAGITNNALMKYVDRSIKFDENGLCDVFANNYNYYIGGIYEVGERSSMQEEPVSHCLDSFSWKKYHDMEWMTKVKDQGSTHYCCAFATVGMLEALVNLSFNDSLEYDLSERDVAKFSGLHYYDGGHLFQTLTYVKENGVVDEDSYSFIDMNLMHDPTPRPTGSECVFLVDYDSININNQTLDSLKMTLMRRGPGASRFGGHATTLVGFSRVKVEDLYYVLDYWYDSIVTIRPNDYERIGRTCWIFKDSYKDSTFHGRPNYPYVLFNDYQYMRNAYFAKSVDGGLPVACRNLSANNVKWTDLDGDGFYFWGLGSRPLQCPSWIPEQSDGDDGDATKGPFGDYCIPSDITPSSTINISSNTIFSG